MTPNAQNGFWTAPRLLVLMIGGFFGVLLFLAIVILRTAQRTGTEIEDDVRETVRSKPLASFDRLSVGNAALERSWITHLTAVDWNRDGTPEIVACDAERNALVSVSRQVDGRYDEKVLGEGLAGPAHVEGVDFDQDGDIDFLVAVMGEIFPNNDKIGAVVLLRNDGDESFSQVVLLDEVARVTDVRAADFDRDGLLDLAVGQFGYYQGEVRWMRNLGEDRFESEILLDLPGTVHTPVADFDNDGDLDFAALVTQEFEEVHVFWNDGQGHFERSIVWGSPNEDYGGSGMTAADVDQDGRMDLVVTNGDGFDYASPGSRAWHGVQWLRNGGSRTFHYNRIGLMAGAYSPVVTDLNGDGYLDVLACSGFNEWEREDAISLQAFMNNGAERFTAVPLAHKPTHLIVVAAADMDGDARPEIISGGFHAYPPWDAMSRLSVWTQHKKAGE